MYKIVILVLLILGSADSLVSSWGQIRNGHFLLFDQLFLDRAASKPEEFYYSTKGMVITGIQVLDLTGTQGGSASVIEGGAHHTYVKMQLLPNDQVLLLNIQIFGVPIELD